MKIYLFVIFVYAQWTYVPVLIAQPADQINVPQGRNAVFGIVVSGQFLKYQWKKDRGNIVGTYSGTNTATFTVTADEVGEYSVLVVNPAAPYGISSSIASLTTCK